MRLIDADALNYTMLYKENWLYGTGVEAPAVWKSDIDNATTVDAVPVVRCKDCVYHGEFNGSDWCTCESTGAGMHKDGFCSDGERRK